MQFNNDRQFTLNYGDPQAPQELTLILNLGCIDTRDWWSVNQATLFKALATGQLKVHFKFWNKVKPPLLNGNVANNYIDYQQPTNALKFIKAVFQNQDPLRNAASVDVPAYLAAAYQVTPYPQAESVQQQIAHEIAVNQLTSLPTVIYQDQAYAEADLPVLATLLAE